jgi:hypothetical protein
LKPRPKKKKKLVFILKLFGNYENTKNVYQLLAGKKIKSR